MKVLILGIGHICRTHYLKWIAQSELVTTIYLFDKFLADEQIRDYLLSAGYDQLHHASFFIVPSSEALPGLFHSVMPDKVFVLTNNASHYSLASLFLENGVDVFVEKPAALNYAEFAKLCGLSKQTKSLFFPAYHQFYRSETYEALHCINNLQLSPRHVTLLVRAGSSSNYPAHQLAGGFSLKSHAGGGVLLDLGSHYISIAFLFLRRLGILYDCSQLHAVNLTCQYSGFPADLFVENHFAASLSSEKFSIKLELSYVKKIDPIIDVVVDGEALMTWPYFTPKYSNMVFKNMTEYFLSSSIDSLDPFGCQSSSYLSDSVMPAIGQAIECIDKLYALVPASDWQQSP